MQKKCIILHLVAINTLYLKTFFPIAHPLNIVLNLRQAVGPYLFSVQINVLEGPRVIDSKDTEKSLSSSHVLVSHCTGTGKVVYSKQSPNGTVLILI